MVVAGRWVMVTSLHTHNSEAHSHTLALTGLALLPSPGKVKRLLSSVLHLGDVGDSSPNLLITGPALPFAPGIDGSLGGEQLSTTQVTSRQMRNGDSSLAH